MPDSTSHAVLAVAMRVHGGRLEALVQRVERLPGESLARALERAIDVGALTHLEQLETRILRDGTLATTYLGLARPGADLAGDWRAVGTRTPLDERELVAAAQARLRAKLSYTNLGFALAPEVFTIDDSGYSDIGQDKEVPPGLEDKAREGVRSCPERALTIDD
jgi:ferredoxin